MLTLPDAILPVLHPFATLFRKVGAEGRLG